MMRFSVAAKGKEMEEILVAGLKARGLIPQDASSVSIHQWSGPNDGFAFSAEYSAAFPAHMESKS